MMLKITDLLHLLPDDDSPRALRKWYLRQSIAVATCALILALFILPAMVWTLPKIGSLAWASEIDRKIEIAIAPIRQDLAELKRKDLAELKAEVLNSTQVAKDIKSSLLGASILDARREQCQLIAAGQRSRFWTDRLIELRAEYRSLTGEQFEMPATCAEI